MGVFTLTINQMQIGKELYLYPNANGCNIDFTPVGEANNWQCVDDPVTIPAGDTTYVYHKIPDVEYDFYSLPNHTVETGTINYVQVFGRAKSHLYTPSPDSIYKIILTESACTDIFKSANMSITSEYATYSEIWTTNPRTSVAWTWSDIDNLQIGSECSSVTIDGAVHTLTLRPTSAGDKTEIPFRPGCDANYQCVDETVRDNFETSLYIWTEEDEPGTIQKTDLYNLTNHADEAGTITKVRVFAWVYHNGLPAANWSRAKIKTHDTEYTGDNWGYSIYQWELKSYEWTVNPNTTNAWTWAEIDDLQAGIEMHAEVRQGKNYVTQLYVVVYYATPDINAEVRTAQEYAVVNYSENVEYTLNKPEEISVNHTQNIKMLNFWSGRRAVYGLTRSKRSMVLTGSQYGVTACASIKYINEMGEAGDEVTISGLGSTQWNKDFRIASFGWKKISAQPLRYDWILELEYA